MENDANDYKDRLKNGQGDLQKAKRYAKQLEEQSKNLEKAVNELGRKSNFQEK